MARRRIGTVQESEEYLIELANRMTAGESAARITMLRLLKSNPSLAYHEIAHRVDVSDRTVRRWWGLYRDGGLTLLLADQDLHHDRDMPSADRREGYAACEPPPRFMRFINSIPTTYEVDEWVRQFRVALADVLDGVDKVSVLVDVGTGLDSSESKPLEVAVLKSVGTSARQRARTYTQSMRKQTPGKMLAAQAERQGFPVEDYYPPSIHDFNSPTGDYVGTILLWSRRGRPTPRHTLEFLETLRAFIVHLFTDCVLRYTRRDPELRLFKDMMVSVAGRIGLTPRETEVFGLLLLGVDRTEIPKRLHIGPSTLKKHVAAIHLKAGTTNFNELIARYYMPLCDD